MEVNVWPVSKVGYSRNPTKPSKDISLINDNAVFVCADCRHLTSGPCEKDLETGKWTKRGKELTCNHCGNKIASIGHFPNADVYIGYPVRKDAPETDASSYKAGDRALLDPPGDGEPDMVNHPPHYTQGGIECIKAIEASMTPEEFRGYLKGTVIKYMWRYRHKGNPVQDLGKAGFYLDLLEEKVKEENGK